MVSSLVTTLVLYQLLCVHSDEQSENGCFIEIVMKLVSECVC